MEIVFILPRVFDTQSSTFSLDFKSAMINGISKQSVSARTTNFDQKKSS